MVIKYRTGFHFYWQATNFLTHEIPLSYLVATDNPLLVSSAEHVLILHGLYSLCLDKDKNQANLVNCRWWLSARTSSVLHFLKCNY